MQEENIQKIISMIVQDLRNNNQGVVVDLIKKAEYSMDSGLITIIGMGALTTISLSSILSIPIMFGLLIR